MKVTKVDKNVMFRKYIVALYNIKLIYLFRR